MGLYITVQAGLLDGVTSYHLAFHSRFSFGLGMSGSDALRLRGDIVLTGTPGPPCIAYTYLGSEAFVRGRRTYQLETILAILHLL